MTVVLIDGKGDRLAHIVIKDGGVTYFSSDERAACISDLGKGVDGDTLYTVCVKPDLKNANLQDLLNEIERRVSEPTTSWG